MNSYLTSLDRSVMLYDGWKFHFESNYKDRKGGTARAPVDARIEEVTNPRRFLVGTWTQGTQKGDFKVVRDN